MLKTFRAEGVAGFYKAGASSGAPTPDAAQGFWPVYFRIGPHTILTFMLWEQLIRLEERWQDDRR